MEYIIIGLLLVVIVLLIILLTKNIGRNNLTSIIFNLEKNTIKELAEFKGAISNDIGNNFINISEKIEDKLRNIDNRVNERIDLNFEKTNKTFANVLERLSKIDEEIGRAHV